MDYQIFQHVYENPDGTISAYNTIKVNNRWISSRVNEKGTPVATRYNQSIEDLNKMLNSIDPESEINMGDWREKGLV